MKKSIIVLSTLSLFAFASCNSTGDQPADKIENQYSTEKPPAAGEVELNAGDDMKFDKNEIRVKAGETVTLTLNHTGKAAITAMGHNFVLLQQGVDMMAFDAEAMKAKDNGYIPNDPKDIIAHTKLIGGGESDVITFTAPAAGTYTFLCTFPGHAASMNGKFIVE